jgi:hypothetical protein
LNLEELRKGCYTVNLIQAAPGEHNLSMARVFRFSGMKGSVREESGSSVSFNGGRSQRGKGTISPKDVAPRPKGERNLTIHKLGWTQAKAAKARAQMAAFAADWDDPVMDIYNEP